MVLLMHQPPAHCPFHRQQGLGPRPLRILGTSSQRCRRGDGWERLPPNVSGAWGQSSKKQGGQCLHVPWTNDLHCSSVALAGGYDCSSGRMRVSAGSVAQNVLAIRPTPTRQSRSKSSPRRLLAMSGSPGWGDVWSASTRRRCTLPRENGRRPQKPVTVRSDASTRTTSPTAA